jgi:putative restriction endonuclease
MASASVFGEIPGYPVGSTFDSRESLRAAGLHRHPMNGISGNSKDVGADAIVISGRYKDDVDKGDQIIYSGEGGRRRGSNIQTFDQRLTRGNAALARSEESGLPVRVIRAKSKTSIYAPSVGLRYDGLYAVRRHWIAPGVDGPMVWRYELERSDAAGEGLWGSAGAAPPAGNPQPGRNWVQGQRVVRNSEISQWVKEMHEGICQFCGTRLDTPAGCYAEGAHIRALGAPHNKPDEVSNVLCLCPNDHVLFDKGALYLEDGMVHRLSDHAALYKLRTITGHDIDWAHAAYHRAHFAHEA